MENNICLDGKLDINLIDKITNLLPETAKLDIPIPYGFAVSKSVYNDYLEKKQQISNESKNQLMDEIKKIEEKSLKKLGSIENPLLLSVQVSSLKTANKIKPIINIGLNDNIAANLAIDEKTAKIIYNKYRELIISYSKMVKDINEEEFISLIEEYKKQRKINSLSDLTAEDLYKITSELKKIYYKLTGEKFPQSPEVQLIEVLKAMFKLIKEDNIEAVIIIEEMTFDVQNQIIKGTAYSASPITGEDKLTGIVSQYKDKIEANITIDELLYSDLNIYKQLDEYSKKLERIYKDIIKIDFVAKDNLVHIVGLDIANKSSKAKVNNIINMYKEGIIDKNTVFKKISSKDLYSILFETINIEKVNNHKEIAQIRSIIPMAVSGQICLSKETVEKVINKNKKAILIIEKITPEDIETIEKVSAVITAENKEIYKSIIETLEKCCVYEYDNIKVDKKNKIVKINGQIYEEGNNITIDGENGKIYEGIVETIEPQDQDLIKKLLINDNNINIIADIYNKKSCQKAINNDSSGLLYKMNYTIFDKEILPCIQRILLIDETATKKEIKKLSPTFIKKLEEVYNNFGQRKVVINLLDNKINSILPEDEKIYSLSKELNIEIEDLKNKITNNLSIQPILKNNDLIKIQAEAIFKAKTNAEKKGIQIIPEIIIPTIYDIKKLKEIKKIIADIADIILKDKRHEYKIGTIIDNPRNCIIANKLAEELDFLIFDSDKLTYLTYGINKKDDIIIKNMLDFDPYNEFDKKGVGKIMTVATKLSKQVNPQIELGIIGSHIDYKDNISFFKAIGITNYYTVPSKIPIIKYNIMRSVIDGN